MLEGSAEKMWKPEMCAFRGAKVREKLRENVRFTILPRGYHNKYKKITIYC